MFTHNFKYTLKTLLKSKALLFWTFAFPIILGFFFNLAFSDIESSEKLEIINIAVVKNDALSDNPYFKDAIDSLSDTSDEDRLFSTTYTTLEESKKLLNEGKITGYIYLDDGPHIVVESSGINETVLNAVVDEINEYSVVAENIATSLYQSGKNPEEIGEMIERELENLSTSAANIVDESNSNMSYTMIEYYTLIAMTCLYGGTISMYAILNLLANISERGKRISISPAKKGTLIASSLLASYIVQLAGLALLFSFVIFVIKVDFGTHILGVIGLSLAGSLAGLALGIFTGTMIKGSENTKTGILIAFTMLGSFFSGMMGITMKYIIDSNVPILNMINPANMITDGFYALYYYGMSNKFYLDLASILVFSIILVLASISTLRRQKYDSI
ncbi:MAG TPA: hypothetical protein DCY94_04565 [Firmicutes bacterium]|nr:hypothetical protein [Bacillota bacterium]